MVKASSRLERKVARKVARAGDASAASTAPLHFQTKRERHVSSVMTQLAKKEVRNAKRERTATGSAAAASTEKKGGARPAASAKSSKFKKRVSLSGAAVAKARAMKLAASSKPTKVSHTEGDQHAETNDAAADAAAPSTAKRKVTAAKRSSADSVSGAAALKRAKKSVKEKRREYLRTRIEQRKTRGSNGARVLNAATQLSGSVGRGITSGPGLGRSLREEIVSRVASRQQLLSQEIKLHQQVMQIPQFKEDPIAAIEQHLDATMDRLLPQTPDVGRRVE